MCVVTFSLHRANFGARVSREEMTIEGERFHKENGTGEGQIIRSTNLGKWLNGSSN